MLLEEGTEFCAGFLNAMRSDFRCLREGSQEPSFESRRRPSRQGSQNGRSMMTGHQRKSVLAPAIGGWVGNAVTQLARALGAKHAISSTTNHAKAGQAKALGFNEVIDISFEKLGEGVRRITGGYGADIVIDGVGDEVFRRALLQTRTRSPKPKN